MPRRILPLSYRWMLLIGTMCILVVIALLAQASYLSFHFEAQVSKDKSTRIEEVVGPLLSYRLNGELTKILGQIQVIFRQVDYLTGRLTPLGESLRSRDLPSLQLLIYPDLAERPAISIGTHYSQKMLASQLLVESDERPLADAFKSKKVNIMPVNGGSIGFTWKTGAADQAYYVIALIDKQSLYRVMQNTSEGNSLALVDPMSWQVLASVGDEEKVRSGISLLRVASGAGRKLASNDSEQFPYYLVLPPTKVFGGLRLVSIVDKPHRHFLNPRIYQDVHLAALAGLVVVLLFLAYPFLRFATDLRQVSYVVGRALQGNFDARTDLSGTSEVATLGQALNVVLEKLSMAMTQLAQKIRLESELSVAKKVQESLFPPSRFSNTFMDIFGISQSASSTGGDWWFYSEIGRRIFIWIGDATGHGASAALLTSAVRAVSAVIEYNPSISPAQALRLLNRAIYDTSKGKMMMTFFLASYDPETSVLEYVNASHDPPFYLPGRVKGVANISEFVPLQEINNPRLGESRDVIFRQASLPLVAGDRFIFYTDGITESVNPMGREWGERRFLNAAASAFSESEDPQTVVKIIREKMESYRQEAPLEDDATLVVASWGQSNG